MFKISKTHDEERTQALKVDCDKLRKSSQDIQATMALLQKKMDNCEAVMGMYSGKEKHKI